MSTTILWFRRDLRLADNPALLAAIENSEHLLPVYIHAPEEETPWAPGSASRWWGYHSLVHLQNELRRRGSELCFIRSKNSAKSLLQLCETFHCKRVVWSRLIAPTAQARDIKVAEALSEAGIQTLNCPANLLAEPGSLHNKQGGPYKVFTPFWNNLQPMLDHLGTPKSAPLRLPPLPDGDIPNQIETLKLLPRTARLKQFAQHWQAGEEGAHKDLGVFLGRLTNYDSDRDRPDIDGSSRLSPRLHFGELSVRQVVHAVRYAPSGSTAFLRELGWREFAHHLLHHFPATTDSPMDERFVEFPWRRSKKDLQSWQEGHTGIPIVDAGMRQLLAQGWMHNRARMIVASFLTKHLRLPWQQGAEWFWENLVDADLANNTLGWQWTAGCGADAAPYFRIFNPVLQGKKFDPAGDYVRRWVPELAVLDAQAIHEPWTKPKALEVAGLQLGREYPKPMIDLAEGRRVALAAYEALKQA